MTGRGMTPAGIFDGMPVRLDVGFPVWHFFQNPSRASPVGGLAVLSRVMRKFVCRLRLNEVSQQ